jgi:hypothetical protein
VESSKSGIAKELLAKSGVIRTAMFVELWTHWSTYVGTDEPKPAFRVLYRSDPQVIDGRIKEKRKFFKKIKQWGPTKKITSMVDADSLDKKLDERRGLRISPLWFRIVKGFAYFLLYLVLTLFVGLLFAPIGSLLLIAGIVKIFRKGFDLIWRQDNDVPPQVVSILRPLENRFAKNLQEWNQEELGDLMELVAALPTWGQNASETRITQAYHSEDYDELNDKRYPKSEGYSGQSSPLDFAGGELGHHIKASGQSSNVNSQPPLPAPLRNSNSNQTPGDGQSKRKINARDIASDINSGLGDLLLMQKYGLSARQLAVLYKKLGERGLLKS